jgi:hypothetical protein
VKEKNDKKLKFWKLKTKFNEKKNQDRKKLSSVMPKLEGQNLQDKKPRINNTILSLEVNKNDFNFYKNTSVGKTNLLNKTNKDYNDLIAAFDSSASDSLSRKKIDLDINWAKLEQQKQKKSWKQKIDSTTNKAEQNSKFLALKNILSTKFVTKSKRRTTFVRMIRSPSEILHKKLQLKRQLTRNLNIQNSENLALTLFELQNSSSNMNDSFTPNQDNNKQRKRTSTWQKNKVVKSKLSGKKLRHSSLGKLKIIAKKYKKIQNYTAIRNWWWQNFLPNFKAKLNLLIEVESNLEKNKILTLSNKEILMRDTKNYEKYNDRITDEKQLQIGTKDYKPLLIPQALRIRKKLFEKTFEQEQDQNIKISLSANINPNNSEEKNAPSSTLIKQTGLQELYTNVLIQNNTNNSRISNTKSIVPVNPTPFYAGWDESIRKFVVTTRLLSKTKAGYEMNFTNSNLENYPTLKNLKVNKFNFQSAPFKGMNLATILYWKVPFSPYDQDQFFNVGIDGFAPLGWRRFKFRHSTKTIKPLLVTTKIVTNQNLINKTNNNKLVYQITSKLFNEPQFENSLTNFTTKNIKKKITRRLMQRIQNYDRSRDTLRFPSGSLINQILPLHYLNVFYKRSRLPGDRYIKRRLRKDQTNVPFNLKTLSTKLTNLTLRRRVKPRRRYHRKNSSVQKLELLPRRTAFRIQSSNLQDELIIQSDFSFRRPFGKEKDTSSTFDNKLGQRVKKRSKNKVKQDSTNLRIRRLRKRVKQQIIRINPRYKPNIGGFIWPGDYLRLELKKAPKLETKLNISTSLKNNRRQPKRLLKELPLPLQPKKYLLQKHNLKVLKRRLAKSHNLNKLPEKMNELANFLH